MQGQNKGCKSVEYVELSSVLAGEESFYAGGKFDAADLMVKKIRKEKC